MKSTFIGCDGSSLNIDPFNLGDGEAWNKTIVAPSGAGMSSAIEAAYKQYRINGGVQFVFDVGPTSFNGITQKMVDDCLANCTTHILLRSN